MMTMTRDKEDTTQIEHRRHDDDHHGNPFLIPFILIFVFAIVEFYTGIWAKSLALLGDAWHMFSDVFALGLAMLASYSASKHKKHPSAPHGQTYVEIMASIANAVLMLIVSIWIVLEALERLQNPHPIAGAYVMVVAFLGLVVNLIVAQRLHHQAHHHGEHENLNHRAALLHVMGDILGSVAALVAGAVVYFTGWLPIDSILSIVISLLLLGVTLHLIKDIWHTLHHDQQGTATPHDHDN
jgi:cobalt-zinc-cadmium efflux system protein